MADIPNSRWCRKQTQNPAKDVRYRSIIFGTCFDIRRKKRKPMYNHAYTHMHIWEWCFLPMIMIMLHFHSKITWSRYLFLLKKNEIQHSLSSVSIRSYKSKNVWAVVLIMHSSSPLLVCSNVNPCVERFFPGWSNNISTRTAIHNSSLKSAMDGDRFLTLTLYSKYMCNEQQWGEVILMLR